MSTTVRTGVACLVLLAILAIDLALLPGHSLSILFALPVLYVGLSDEPRPTIAVGIFAMGLDLLSIILAPTPPVTWPLTFVALCIVAYLSAIEAYRRQHRALREQRYQHAINLAQEIRQPLTVIIARSQMILAHEKTGGIAEALHTIELAGRRIDDIVENVILSGSEMR
jgi:signal transduction histidine kinase